jgi:transcriptional regulator with XRE-family HTH domain
MNGQPRESTLELARKIGRLVEERGWNQEDFARIAQLNRQTVRQILQADGKRRLRNVTISRCAKALGLTVNELRSVPLERLLPRMNNPRASNGTDTSRRIYELATQPELLAWIERNPERAGSLTEGEIEELLSLQGAGGPLTRIGVEHYVDVIERKRRLFQQVHSVAGTEYLGLLEQLVTLLYEKVQPYADRA